jgi:hypothetical protein
MGGHWYTAVLVLRSSIADAPEQEPLCDVQYRILEAPDHEAAYAKAMTLGKSASQEYENADGEQVVWRFVGLHDLTKLDDAPADGVEVYSQMYRGRDELVVQKLNLTAFWVEANGHKTVSELIAEREPSA